VALHRDRDLSHFTARQAEVCEVRLAIVVDYDVAGLRSRCDRRLARGHGRGRRRFLRTARAASPLVSLLAGEPVAQSDAADEVADNIMLESPSGRLRGRLTMPGWCNWAAARASRKNFSLFLGVMPPARGILIATVRRALLSRAFQTLPKPPTPNRSISSKRQLRERRRHPRGLALVHKTESGYRIRNR